MQNEDQPSSSGEAPISFAAVVASDPPAEPEAAHHAAPTAPLEDAPPPAPTEEVIEAWPTPAEAEETEADTPPTPNPTPQVPRAGQQPSPAPPTPAAADAAAAAEPAATPAVTSAAGADASGAAKIQPKGLGTALVKPKPGRKADASSSAAGGSSSATSAAAGSSQSRGGKSPSRGGSKAAAGGAGNGGLDLKDKLGFSLEELGVDHPLEDSSEWESVGSEDEGNAALGGAASPAAGRAGRPAPGPSRLQAEAQRVKEESKAWVAALTDLFDHSTLVLCGAVLTTCAAGLLLLGARAAVRR